MSLLATILPFIIIIAFIAIGSYFYKIGKKFFTIKMTHWLLSVYLIVLIIATAIVPMVTDSKKAMEKVNQEDQDEMIDSLYNHLQKGEIDSIEDEFLVLERTFEHDQKDPLQINTESNDLGVSVFIEQKSENDGYIEASVYRPSMTINKMDFSEVLDPYELEKDSDSLIIHAPIQDIHVSILGPSLPVRQLTQSSIISHYSSSSAEGIIYLRVPSDIKITSSDHVYLNYVGK